MSRGARVVGARPRVGGARAPVVAEVGHLQVRVGTAHLGAHWNGMHGLLDRRIKHIGNQAQKTGWEIKHRNICTSSKK